MADTTRPNTAVMRQCAAGHRQLAGIYALDTSEGAETVRDGSAITALLLEEAADWIEAQDRCARCGHDRKHHGPMCALCSPVTDRLCIAFKEPNRPLQVDPATLPGSACSDCNPLSGTKCDRCANAEPRDAPPS